jgi:DNA polymerase III subunit gamma/tau
MTEAHYLALYRKYRPQTFEDVCGRDAIVQTLKNQINSGRIGHSYLFCGTRGTGKTTIAKIYAKAVNCRNPVDGNPCGKCETCRAIAENADLNVVEMDAASNNGVDDVRGIIEQVSYSPTLGKYRVFIIDEVHMLSTPAFNALLKTLEEPPSYAIFVLCTTEPNKLPVTILSRCQRYDFGRIPLATIASRLKTVCEREGIVAEEEAISFIASAADGSMRDGLSILDQCNAFNYGEKTLTYEKTLEILGALDAGVFSKLYRCIHVQDVRGALNILNEILEQGRELMQFVTDYIGYLRNVMLLKASEETADALDVSQDHLAKMLEDARSSELNEIIRYINIFSSLTEQIRYSANRRILTESAIIRLCEPSMDVSRDIQTKVLTLEERIRFLEDKLTALAQNGQLAAVSERGGEESGPQIRSLSASGYSDENGGQHSPDKARSAEQAAGGTPRNKLPKVLPEELSNLAANWDRLIAAIPPEERFAKICLQKAYPTATEDGQLMVVFENFLGADYFMGRESADNAKFFSDYLAARTGRNIPVRYKFLDKGRKFSDNYQDLRSAVNTEAIHMEIEEDED